MVNLFGTSVCSLILIELSLLPSHTNWEIGALSCLLKCNNFQGIATRSMRKVFLNCKTGKRLGEDLYLKGAEKKIPIACF